MANIGLDTPHEMEISRHMCKTGHKFGQMDIRELEIVPLDTGCPGPGKALSLHPELAGVLK